MTSTQATGIALFSTPLVGLLTASIGYLIVRLISFLDDHNISRSAVLIGFSIGLFILGLPLFFLGGG